MLKKRDSKVNSIAEFFAEKEGVLNPPNGYSYPNMDDAVELFWKHCQGFDPTVVYGDYDADGVMSLSEAEYLKRGIGINPNLYRFDTIAPDRFSDGYGLTMDRAKSFVDEGYKLVITVDNGISAVDPIRYLRENNVDVIVLDHHELNGEIPNANVIVDPHVTGGDEKTGFDDLCGAGLMLIFATKVLKKIHSLAPERRKSLTDTLLALAAIGTVADCVSLTYQNRLIVKEGLNRINAGELPFAVKDFINNLVGDSFVDSDTIGYTIGPAINAAGRLKTNGANVVVKTLTAPNVFMSNFKQYLDAIKDVNEERKLLVSEEVARAISISNITETDKVVVYHNVLGKPGIMGLVASELAREFKRPAIALCGDGVAKGSARSYGDIDIFAVISQAKDLLSSFGGHPQACGLSIAIDNINAFKDKLNEACPVIEDTGDEYYDLEVSKENVTDYLEELKKYEPFGEGNRKPTFLLKTTAQNVCWLGKEFNHLKIGTNDIDILLFGYRNKGFVPKAQDLINVIGELNENVYNGEVHQQLPAEYVEKQKQRRSKKAVAEE